MLGVHGRPWGWGRAERRWHGAAREEGCGSGSIAAPGLLRGDGEGRAVSPAQARLQRPPRLLSALHVFALQEAWSFVFGGCPCVLVLVKTEPIFF